MVTQSISITRRNISFFLCFVLLILLPQLCKNNIESVSFDDIYTDPLDHQKLNANNYVDVNSLFINYSTIPQKRIYFDMSHKQVSSIWDTGFEGYSDFCIMLQQYGLETSTITTSLNEYILNMTSNDTLFLNVAKYGNYTLEEIGNIVNFVDRGGKVIILGEHNVQNFTQFQNPLLQQFGMEIIIDNNTHDNGIIDNYYNTQGRGYWIIFNSSYFGLTNLSIMYGPGLNLSGNAFAIARSSHLADPPNAPVMAGYNNANGGKVFCCTDAEWLWNCNRSLGGIHYGNNSQLVLRVLDWFYDTTQSQIIEQSIGIIPEYHLFTAPQHANFTLNITSTHLFNVSVQVNGGSIFPHYKNNVIGKEGWDINVSTHGYAEFTFTNNVYDINISKTVYFLEGKAYKKVLFLERNFSRSVDPSPSGLLKLAYDFVCRNYSVFASQTDVNISTYSCIVIANPLQEYTSSTVSSLRTYSNRIILLNGPYSSLLMEDPMADFFRYEYYNFSPNIVPMNTISSEYGINFSHHIVCDYKRNGGNKMYIPKIMGVNSTFYNISCYMPSVIQASNSYYKELIGYNGSWGEDHSTFGTSFEMGGPNYGDINDTSVLVYNETVLASGMLHYFTNEYYEFDSYFNDFFFNWVESGKFSKKYQLVSNRTTFITKDIHFLVFSLDSLYDIEGSIIPDGTIFNVRHSLGTILSVDEDPTIKGFQVVAYDNAVNVSLSSLDHNGLFELCIYNASPHYVILSIFLNFLYTAPDIVVHLPYNNSYWHQVPLLNVSSSSNDIDSIWYNVQGIAKNVSIGNGIAEFLDDEVWSLIPEGQFVLDFYVNDTSGNVNSSFLVLHKDFAPQLLIHEPLNNSRHNLPLSIKVTVYEYNLDSIWYTISGVSTAIDNNTEYILPESIWEGLPEGSFTILFSANDTLGQFRSAIYTIHKDTEAPQLFVHEPLTNETFGKTAPYLNITVIGSDVGQVWYTLPNSSVIFFVDEYYEMINQTVWDDLHDGIVFLCLYVNDTLGNINNVVVTIIKDMSPNVSIPKISYGLYLLIFCVIGVGYLILRSIKKNYLTTRTS